MFLASFSVSQFLAERFLRDWARQRVAVQVPALATLTAATQRSTSSTRTALAPTILPLREYPPLTTRGPTQTIQRASLG
jgi:hypothetical protein